MIKFRITPYRALWVLKLYSAFANTQAPSQKGRRSNTEVSIEGKTKKKRKSHLIDDLN